MANHLQGVINWKLTNSGQSFEGTADEMQVTEPSNSHPSIVSRIPNLQEIRRHLVLSHPLHYFKEPLPPISQSVVMPSSTAGSRTFLMTPV